MVVGDLDKQGLDTFFSAYSNAAEIYEGICWFSWSQPYSQLVVRLMKCSANLKSG